MGWGRRANSLGSLISLLLLGACACHCFDQSCILPDAKPDPVNSLIEIGGTSDSDTAGPLKSIHFDYKQEMPINAEWQFLKDNLAFLKSSPKVKVTLEGHGDETGGTEYNEKLGMKRVRFVEKYLLDNGIDPSRVKIVSMSSRVPLSDPEDDSALKKQKDRRVNFLINEM